MARATVEYDGLTWTQRDDGYYGRGRRLLHRYVYEREHGPIPDGWHVHHGDLDQENNTGGNLVALTPSAHAAIHADSRTPEWHAAGGRASVAARPTLTGTCTVCGSSFTSRATILPRYCSPRCRDRGAPSRAHEPRVCVVCGVGFTCQRRSRTRTCSPRCRSVAAYAARPGVRPSS